VTGQALEEEGESLMSAEEQSQMEEEFRWMCVLCRECCLQCESWSCVLARARVLYRGELAYTGCLIRVRLAGGHRCDCVAGDAAALPLGDSSGPPLPVRYTLCVYGVAYREGWVYIPAVAPASNAASDAPFIGWQ
jgi:hypothetical protein